MAKRIGLTTDNHSLRRNEGLEPSGTIKVWSISIVPDGWLELNGAAITQAQYPSLYSIFGANLPNMIGRTVVGAGTYNDPVSGSITRVLGAFNGAEKHLLTADEIGNPRHYHNTSGITLGLSGSHKHYMFMKNTDPITFSVKQSNDVTMLNPSYKVDQSWQYGGSGDYGYYYYGLSNGDANSGATSLSGAHSHTLSGEVFPSTSASAANKHNNMQPYLVQKWIVKI